MKNDRKSATAFRGVYACDELPDRASANSLYVCNTDPSDRPGEHWVVIYFDDASRGEYFDSFGLHPSIASFEKFLCENSVVWKCNAKQVQSVFSDACGYHCVFFAVHRCAGYDMNAVVNMCSGDLDFNDAAVKAFVRLKTNNVHKARTYRFNRVCRA